MRDDRIDRVTLRRWMESRPRSLGPRGPDEGVRRHALVGDDLGEIFWEIIAMRLFRPILRFSVCFFFLKFLMFCISH